MHREPQWLYQKHTMESYMLTWDWDGCVIKFLQQRVHAVHHSPVQARIYSISKSVGFLTISNHKGKAKVTPESKIVYRN